MSNKGKSYLIGRINGMDDIPVGYDVHTRGISLVRGKSFFLFFSFLNYYLF